MFVRAKNQAFQANQLQRRSADVISGAALLDNALVDNHNALSE